jgi:hypothetical protein
MQEPLGFRGLQYIRVWPAEINGKVKTLIEESNLS